MSESKKVLHIINSLSGGGAEAMLVKVLKESKSDISLNHLVLTIKDEGRLIEEVESLNIKLYSISHKNIFSIFGGFFKLLKFIYKEKPNKVIGWMYHGSFLATIIYLFSKNLSLFWNIRHSIYDLSHEKLSTRFIIFLLSLLTYFPKKIIYNSREGAYLHEEFGFDKTKRELIFNGFDIKKFKPNEVLRERLRNKIGLKKNKRLIGVVARFHPIKGHKEFIESSFLLSSKFDDIEFLLAGEDINRDNEELMRLIQEKGLEHKFHLIGEITEPENIYPCLDLLCVPSLSEGFPNVIGEAMLCEVPVVATDVGASAQVVGNLGGLVEPGNTSSLANSLGEFLSKDLIEIQKLGKLCRNQIKENYNITDIYQEYSSLLKTK